MSLNKKKIRQEPVSRDSQRRNHSNKKGPLSDPKEQELENAGQERGERIETGKAIARGGKTKGHVPGAM